MLMLQTFQQYFTILMNIEWKIRLYPGLGSIEFKWIFTNNSHLKWLLFNKQKEINIISMFNIFEKEIFRIKLC